MPIYEVISWFGMILSCNQAIVNFSIERKS
jgi:hypothetical protein